jgi:sec-independent protein translocase protein TatC
MSSENKNGKPKTFGEKFKEDGLVGMLKKKNGSAKPKANDMHFLEHLEELRWVILKAVLAFLAGCIGIAVFLDDSVKLLQMPLVSAVEDFGEIDVDLQSIGLEEYTKMLRAQEVDLRMLRNAQEEELENWGITDPHHQTRILSHFSGGKNRNLLQVIRSFSPIFIAMKICFLGGIGISLPLILYFVGSFVIPGLTPQEKRVFFPGCLAATFLFLAGASMTYFFILPYSLAFTIEFSFNVLGLDVYRPEAGNYYSTVIWMTFAVGIAFQFPLILILLIKIGILSVAKLRGSRRLVLVILMISAALITPGGDPVSLCILTIPLYILYELAIITGAVIEKAKERKEWEEWDEELQGPKPPKPKREKLRWVLYLACALTLLGLGALYVQNKGAVDSKLRAIAELFSFSQEVEPEDLNASASENNSSVGPLREMVKTGIPSLFPGREFLLELTPLDRNSTFATDSNSSGTFYRAVVREK